MSSDIATDSQKSKSNTKLNLIVYAVTALFFLVALYNVYGFFLERQRLAQEKEDLRVAQVAEQLAKRLEAERQAKLEHETRLNEIALAKEKSEVELLEKKIEQQERLKQYEVLKNAKKVAKENKRLQRRIEVARSLNNPEGLPRKVIDSIRSATSLTIENNPKDYLGNYKPTSILKTDKLTSGGADGLMLFSMVSTDLEAIGQVIEIGHDVNTQNKSGYTPLMFASAYNTSEVVLFLLEQGADPKTTNYLSEGNSLHLASRFNPKPEVVEALVKRGFDIEAKDKDGNTPLLVAVKYNQNLQVVEKLIDLGADTSAVDNSGNVAYSYAYERINKRVPMGRFERISEEYETSLLEQLIGKF